MITPYKVNAIIRNIESVFKNRDVDKLSKSGYDFLYLMSGFIAHYDINGFKNAYSDLRDLINDIKGSLPIEKDVAKRDINDPEHNGYGLPYCQSKLEVVEGLEKIVEKYEKEIEKDFREIEKQEIKQEISSLQARLSSF